MAGHGVPQGGPSSKQAAGSPQRPCVAPGLRTSRPTLGLSRLLPSSGLCFPICLGTVGPGDPWEPAWLGQSRAVSPFSHQRHLPQQRLCPSGKLCVAVPRAPQGHLPSPTACLSSESLQERVPWSPGHPKLVQAGGPPWLPRAAPWSVFTRTLGGSSGSIWKAGLCGPPGDPLCGDGISRQHLKIRRFHMKI